MEVGLRPQLLTSILLYWENSLAKEVDGAFFFEIFEATGTENNDIA